MKELQALYEERNKLYSEENIKAMNEEIKAFKGVLIILNSFLKRLIFIIF